ncbi:MAG: hypothetical protein AAFO62_07850, partial [Pseudomonadota bacterium]
RIWRRLTSLIARRCLGPACRAVWFGQPADRACFGDDLWPANPAPFSRAVPLPEWLSARGGPVTRASLRAAGT